MKESRQQHWPQKRFGTLILIVAYGATAVISLAPGSARPETVLASGNIEHLAWYGLLGILTAGILRHTVDSWWLAGLVAAYGGFMELGQPLVPSRTASFETFLFSAAGGVLGVLLMTVLARSLFSRT